MVEFNSIYPDEEDIKLAFDRAMSLRREADRDIEDIFNRLIRGHTYIDKDECARVLHCKASEIPAALPYYRASRTGNAGVLYKLSEVYDFIEERRVPKK